MPHDPSVKSAVANDAFDSAAIKDILVEAGEILEAVYRLTQSAVIPSDFNLSDIWRRLKATCDAVEPLIVRGADGRPQLLVMGQPKCGKSSLVNEMLGQTIVSQSQGPDESLLSELRKLRYSPNPYQRRSSDKENNVDSKTEGLDSDLASLAIVELGIRNDLLQRSGIEIIDSPAGPDLPPVTKWPLGAAAPAAIVYVIDAADGINREVEEDLLQLRFGCSSSQLIIVLNKIDLTPSVSDCHEAVDSTVRSRVLARLQQLRCITNEKGTDNFFYLSCRQLKSIRRQPDKIESFSGEKDIMVNELIRLRSTVLTCISSRLEKQLRALMPLLEEASKVFDDHVIRTIALRDSKRLAWSFILDLTKQIYGPDRQSAAGAEDFNSTLMAEKMRHTIKERKAEINEAIRTMELKEPANPQQNWAEEQIERRIIELQSNLCQEYVNALIADRLRPTDDLIAKLTEFQAVHFDTTLAPELNRKLIVKLEVERRQTRLGRTLSRRFSSSAAEVFRQRLPKQQQQQWADPKWRLDTAANYMRSSDLEPALKRCADQLNTLIYVAQADTQEAVERAKPLVDALLAGLKSRRNCLRDSSLTCLKLWLRLFSVLCESSFNKLLLAERSCIAVGSHGSPLYALNCVNSESEPVSMVIKKLYLDDKQLRAMASSLHYSCTTDHKFLLRIQYLKIKKLNKEPSLWKLLICTERLAYSLQHQLDKLCQDSLLSNRLRIGLSIAEALVQMHRDRQPHLNLHLANIFLCPDGQSVRLTDPGLARSVGLLFERQKASLFHGPFPPELLPQQSGKPVRSVIYNSVDVFSLGVLLRALAFGCKQTAQHSKNESADEINSIIKDCTKDNPAQRISSVEVVTRLRQILVDEPKSDYIY